MKDTRVATGIQTYTFTDEDDHVFASFRLNPTDINLAKRALEVGEYFERLKDIEPKTVEELAAMNDAMEQKISYVLGYEASDIFGEVTATTVFQDGTVFAILVVDTIIEAVQPALQNRAKTIQEKSAKYLEKYE
jgi:hypothetical protein